MAKSMDWMMSTEPSSPLVSTSRGVRPSSSA